MSCSSHFVRRVAGRNRLVACATKDRFYGQSPGRSLAQPLVHGEEQDDDKRQCKVRPEAPEPMRRLSQGERTGDAGFFAALPNRGSQLPVSGSTQNDWDSIKKLVRRLGPRCSNGG